jgi:ABC-type sulfate transport system substrate-binding protein
MSWNRLLAYAGFTAAYLFVMTVTVLAAEASILNVSYDVSRQVQAKHFADGAIYDQTLARR